MYLLIYFKTAHRNWTQKAKQKKNMYNKLEINIFTQNKYSLHVAKKNIDQ